MLTDHSLLALWDKELLDFVTTRVNASVKKALIAERNLAQKRVKLDHNLLHKYFVLVEFMNSLETKNFFVQRITEDITTALGILFAPTVHHPGLLKLNVHRTLNATVLELTQLAEPEVLLTLAFLKLMLKLEFAMFKNGMVSIFQKVQLLLALKELTAFGELMETPYALMTFHVTNLIAAMNTLTALMDKFALSTHHAEKVENALLWLK